MAAKLAEPIKNFLSLLAVKNPLLTYAMYVTTFTFNLSSGYALGAGVSAPSAGVSAPSAGASAPAGLAAFSAGAFAFSAAESAGAVVDELPFAFVALPFALDVVFSGLAPFCFAI